MKKLLTVETNFNLIWKKSEAATL